MTIKTASSQKTTLFGALAALTEEISGEKTAAATEKSAGLTPSDPGGYEGASTHPTTAIDNRGEVAQEGARSAENVADNKADEPVGVDQTPIAKPGQDEQDSSQLNIGTQQSSTGEDPSVEDAYKTEKEDPGSAHPAVAGADSEKYSSFKAAHVASTGLANDILADLANGFGNQLGKQANLGKRADDDDDDDDDEDSYDSEMDSNTHSPATSSSGYSSDPKSRTETSAPMTAIPTSKGEHVQVGDKNKATGVSPELLKDAANAVAPEEMAAGYELAAHLGLQKAAAEASVETCISETIKDAQIDADLFGSYYVGLVDNMSKQAMPDDVSELDAGATEPGPPEGGGEGPPPDLAGGPGGAGDGGPPPEGGGGGLEDLLSGGEPPMDGGMGGDIMGGGVGQEEAVAQLAAALEELGIPLEALAQAGGGGGGGLEMGGEPPIPPMDGGMGGGPPMGPEGAVPPMGGPEPGMEVMASAKRAQQRAQGQKLAAAVSNYKKSGKFQFKTANEGTRERQLRDTMKNVALELINS